MKMHMIGDIIQDRKEGSKSQHHASARTCAPVRRPFVRHHPCEQADARCGRRRPRGGKLTRRGCSKFSAGTLRLHRSSRQAGKENDRATGPTRARRSAIRLTASQDTRHSCLYNPECPVAGSSCGMGITISYGRACTCVPALRGGSGNRLSGGTNECAELLDISVTGIRRRS